MDFLSCLRKVQSEKIQVLGTPSSLKEISAEGGHFVFLQASFLVLQRSVLGRTLCLARLRRA